MVGFTMPQETKKELHRLLESIIGCKWSLGVIDAVQRGINRPGAMEREIKGISSKVLSERLKKLTLFKVLERQEYPEIPPRVEYALTARGQKLVSLIDAINRLAKDW